VTLRSSSAPARAINVTIGARSFIQETDLADGTVVPDHSVIIGGMNMGKVEWDATGDAPVSVTPSPSPVRAATLPRRRSFRPRSSRKPSSVPMAPTGGFVRRLGEG